MATLAGSFNGLSFGPGTSYHVSGVEGLWDADGVEDRDLPRIGNGAFVGRDRQGGRRVILTLTLIADTPAAYDSLVSDLIDATEPGAGDNLLTANQASVETDASGWGFAINATLARSTAQAADGTASLLMTPVSAGDISAVTNPQSSPVIAGRRYTGLASFRGTTVNRDARVVLEWETPTGSNGTTTGTNITSVTTGWTVATVAGVAPAGTTRGRLRAYALSASEGHYVDRAAIHQGPNTVWTEGGKHMRIERPLRLMGNTVWLNVRPRRRIIPIATDTYQRTGVATIEFFASNPSVYTGAP